MMGTLILTIQNGDKSQTLYFKDISKAIETLVVLDRKYNHKYKIKLEIELPWGYETVIVLN